MNNSDITSSNGIEWLNFSRHIEKEKHQRIISKFFAEIPFHWLPLLLPFETSKPEKYYCEQVFKMVGEVLASAFKNDMPYFQESLSAFSSQLDAAYANHNRVSKELLDKPSAEADRELLFRQHIFPIYLELIEGVWRPLARICTIAIEKPNSSNINNYLSYDLNILEQKLKNKHNKLELFSGWDRDLRNNIAHITYEFSDEVTKQDAVSLYNPEGIHIRDVWDNEINSLLIDLYDCASAMIFGILKYIALTEQENDFLSLGHYIRSQIVAKAFEDPHIEVESNTIAQASEGNQRNIMIRYKYPCDSRATMFAFYVLKLMVRFIPTDNYFIAIGPSQGKQYLWIMTNHNKAHSFLNGTFKLEDYFKTGDIQIFKDVRMLARKPRNPLFLRLLPFLIKASSVVWMREIRSFRGWYIAYDKNFSTGLSERYEIIVVQHRELTQKEIRSVIKKVIRKKQAVFKHLLLIIWDLIRITFRRKIFARPPVNVILVHVWKKEKRMSQMSLNPREGHPLCICCAEWNRDASFSWLDQSALDEKLKDIILRWF